MRQLQSPWIEVRDEDVVLMLEGAVVVFAGTPQGVFNANGRRVGDNFEEFKRVLGRPTVEGNPAEPSVKKALQWFKRTHQELVRDPNAPATFDPRLFMQERDLTQPDTFRVSCVEDAEEQAAKVARASIEARALGAHPKFLKMLDAWERGWQSLGKKFNRMEFGDTGVASKGPKPADLAKRAAKRQADQAYRLKTKGKAGGGKGK